MEKVFVSPRELRKIRGTQTRVCHVVCRQVGPMPPAKGIGLFQGLWQTVSLLRASSLDGVLPGQGKAGPPEISRTHLALDMTATTSASSFMGTHLLKCYQLCVRHVFLRGDEVSGECVSCHVFTVPKMNSAKGKLVLYLSSLNRFIKNYRFRKLTLAQVCLLSPAG